MLDSAVGLTDEDEADGDDVRQHVASERLVVLAVAFAKDADERVEFVLTQTLTGEQEESSWGDVDTVCRGRTC